MTDVEIIVLVYTVGLSFVRRQLLPRSSSVLATKQRHSLGKLTRVHNIAC